MFSMFSPDSKIMQVIGRICDLVLLNIVFLLCCLPVFTFGAAVSALYTVCFRMMREEDSHILKQYFRAFRENFRQGTSIGILLLVIVAPALCYFDRAFRLETAARYGSLLFLFIAMAGLLAGSWVFPWISQFRNTTRQALVNALILSITQLPRSLCILVIWLLPVLLWAANYDLFLKISFLWLALYFAAAAYMSTGLLWNVFKPYRESQT